MSPSAYAARPARGWNAAASSAEAFWGIHLQWFAAEDEGRTEEPTEYRLRKAREEGRVPKSQEFASALIMLVPASALVFLAPALLRDCAEALRYFFQRSADTRFTETGVAQGFFRYFLKMTAPLFAVAAVSAIAANVAQTRGFLFSTKPLEPDFSRIIPNFGNFLKKTVFSGEGAFNLLKTLVKVAAVFVASWVIIRGGMERLLSFTGMDGLHAQVSFIALMTAKLLITGALVFLALAVPDYAVQRRRFMESMKMTKQEVMQEFKEMEGDRLVKGRISTRMREILAGNVQKSVAQSDVVVTNPTHFAVALKYDRMTMDAPMVTAKGQDNRALRIRELAREYGVPVMENKPLARALYAETSEGDTIPEKYFNALVIIFQKVYALRGRTA